MGGVRMLGMVMKKTFDCVDEKNRVQEELMREYQARKSEFVSYADFINQTLVSQQAEHPES